MRLTRQSTLKRPGSVKGVGLHTGLASQIFLRPAPANAGVVFRRTDFSRGAGDIRACPEAVVDTRLGVTLANGDGARVMTIEHLMAALAIAGIDNAVVETDSGEIPILDGSASPFIELIDHCGRLEQDAPRDAVVIVEPIRVESGERFIEITPAATRTLEVCIDFADAAIGRQTARLQLDDADAMRRRLAPARTFCTLRDVDVMRAAGLAQGGSLDNALVVDGARLLNETGLRDGEEFALHKALDLIGDLALLGAPVIGDIVAFKPGHDLNTLLARRIGEAEAAGRRPLDPPVRKRLSA